MYANKIDVASIAHQVGPSRQGVYNYLKMKQPPERTRINQPRKPLIEPYKDYLVKRWNEGCHNAQQVYREIKEQGYTGSDQPIMRYFVRFRTQKDARKFKQVDPGLPWFERVGELGIYFVKRGNQDAERPTNVYAGV